MEHFRDIPVNQYQKRMADVRGEYSDADLKAIYHDMYAIRTFESMLQDLRLTGSYNGADYNYSGPAQLCIGQECAAVDRPLRWTRTTSSSAPIAVMAN